MELKQILFEYHDRIVATWFDDLYNARHKRYSQVPEEELRGLLGQAATSFRKVLLDDQWGDLRNFITNIARKRFKEGFRVSEVQQAFELYRQTLLPLLCAKMDPVKLDRALLHLQKCMVFAITSFSEIFQNIHEDVLRSQAIFLEKEVARRTRELEESQQKYKTLVEEINDGYFVLINQRLIFVNRAFADMHGFQPGEMRNCLYLDFVAPESAAAVSLAYKNIIHGKRSPSRLEYMRLHQDGRKLPTEIISTPTNYEEQPAIIGICRDISKRVELEKKTREAEKLKALAQQAAALAHDVRNPLSAIKMNLQLFSREERNPAQKLLLDTSLSEIDRIEGSLLEMMDLRISYSLKRQRVELRELLRNCIKSMHQRLEKNQIEVSLRLSRSIKYLTLDPHRMEQALVNLLFNAIEAQPSGGKIILTTRLLELEGRAWAILLVSDDGPGIPAEVLPYVFDPLFSQKKMGRGLGLSNVKKIIEAHGGQVEVKPRRPLGTSFSLKFPMEN